MVSATCTSSAIDPRCAIDAPEEYVPTLAKSVNGSALWQAYFEVVAPSPTGAQPLVEISLELDRRVRKSYGGDYDPGDVDIEFKITHLASGALLFRKEESVGLDSFIIGAFDGDASREQIQEAAFKATEQQIFPFVDRWINIAAIRAMAEEGLSAFTPILEEQVQDPWSEQLAGEAKAALKAIRGS